MEKKLAPIVLFVYNRPWHTRQTLEALSKNSLADQSILYIYADGAKENATDAQLNEIKEVRCLIREKKWCKQVEIIEREKNIGVENVMITGITEIINKYYFSKSRFSINSIPQTLQLPCVTEPLSLQ